MRHLLFLLALISFFGCDPTTTTSNNTTNTPPTTTTNTTTTQPSTTTQPATTDGTTKNPARLDTDKTGFVGKWIHSKEEDTDKEEVFRKEGYKFPPARGRKNVIINANNTVFYNKIAANDAFDRVNGRLEKVDATKFQIVLEDGHATTINGELNKGILKLGKKALPK